MAITDPKQGSSAAGRRWFFGTNVTVLMVLAVFLTVGVNWVGHRNNSRTDLSGGFSSHRMSERSKRIIEKAEGGLRITTVYTSDEPDTDRKKYLPTLQDLCEEIRQLNRKIEVQHLYSGNQRAELRDRVQGKFGTAAEEYSVVVKLSGTMWDNLGRTLGPVRQELDAALQDKECWLGGFTKLARYASKLRQSLETDLEESRREVDTAVHGEGIPRFQEANQKIKAFDDELKKDLEGLRDWLKSMNKLAGILTKSDSEFATRTRTEVGALEMLTKNLAVAAGDANDATVPDDPKPVLKDIAKAANALAAALVDEAGRVNGFVKENPALEEHPKWLLSVQQGPLVFKMPLTVFLTEAANNLSGRVQGLRQILDQDVPKDQLQSVVRRLRQDAGEVQQQLGVWKQGILGILDESAQIDERSKSLMDRAGRGELFKSGEKDLLDQIKEIGQKIDNLPKLELDEIAKRLQEDNIVVIETDKDVKVVTFDDVWPIADPLAGRMRPDEKESAQRRVFDGDSAISGALLSMQAKERFATVVLVGYESTPSPQMMQMGQRRNTGRLPMEEFGKLKEKLQQANFEVKEWNLGAEGDEAKKPEIKEGTKAIYVLLPPAPEMPPNPMMRQQPPKSFGEAELAKVREVLDAPGGARAIFLAAWEPPRMSMFGPMPASYAYDELLKDDWGLKVHEDYRLLRLVPDTKEVDRYAVDVLEISHMQLNNFTDQPIGKPLKARRMLMTDVCPVTPVTEGKLPEPDAKVPEGVTIAPVLRIPEGVRDLIAENNAGIQRVSEILRSGERRGRFAKDPGTTWDPPFSVIVAAEKKAKTADKNEGDQASATTQPAARSSRIVVMGTGASLIDFHLDRPVPRFEVGGKRAAFLTDSPPMECAEPFINAVYWLNDQEDMIAAGPAEVPLVPALQEGDRLRASVVTFGWAFVVLIAGLVMMFVRRK